MDVVKVSTKFQIVLPKAVRERLGIRPGQRLGVVEKDGVAHLVPLRSLDELRRYFEGVDYTGHRDKRDRF